MNIVDLKTCTDLYRHGFFEKSERCFQKIICASPDLPEALHLFSVLLIKTNRLNTALCVISRAIYVCREKSIFFSDRAKLLHALGDYERVSADLRYGIALSPDDPELLCNMGVSHLESNRNRLALSLTSRCLVVDEMHSRGHCHLGVIFDRAGDYLVARKQFERAICFDPAFAEAWFNRSSVSMSLGGYDGVEGGFRIAKLSGIQGVAIDLNLAFLYLLGGRFSDGWQVYEERWRDDEFVRSQRLLPGLRESRPAFAGSGSKRVLVWAEQGVGER
jgi:Flp pilus assembly protein TadD